MQSLKLMPVLKSIQRRRLIFFMKGKALKDPVPWVLPWVLPWHCPLKLHTQILRIKTAVLKIGQLCRFLKLQSFQQKKRTEVHKKSRRFSIGTTHIYI